MVDDPRDPGDPDPVPATLAPGTITAGEAGLAAAPVLPAAGYTLGAVIGRGGMGEVHAARDARIGREVALKRMRSATPSGEALARFLREARIQGRLDHPAIVPVHELGVDASGRPYFTMKRIAGVTLSRRLADGTPLHPLLRAFVDVCRAVELAHARGVVHRDLKPANIMLGDYGEVYVLDWGVAREVGDPAGELAGDSLGSAAAAPGAPAAGPDDSTKSGALLGTPGYISPEQIQGMPAAPATDVYALGCVLFEILAGEPLHPRGQPGLGRTLSAPQASPALRRPERAIPPELDVACFHALSDAPAERPTARELAAQVEAYLDGDRDLERRRVLAARQLAAARDALDAGGPDARATAMRRAGRALALDPESPAAAELVGGLLLEPPSAMPPDLIASLDAEERALASDRNRKATLTYLSVFALLPVALVLDVKSPLSLIAFYAAIGAAAALSWLAARRGRASMPVVLAINLVLALLFSRIASPFVLTPLLICGVLVAATANPWLGDRRWIVIGWTTTAVLLPIGLERLGAIAETWSIDTTAIMIESAMFAAHGSPDEIALIVTNLMFTLAVGLFAFSINRQRRLAQRALHVQAWHLRQLLPSARAPATRPR